MKIEKTESLFNNDKEYLTILEGITQDDVIVKTSNSEKNADRAVDSKYSFDRSLWASVYVVLKPEIVETLKSINPQLLKCTQLSQILREKEECYNRHETYRLEFKFTGIRTRKKKIEKYEGVYNTFIKDLPRVTELFTNNLLGNINEYLVGQASYINETYTRNHIELFTDDIIHYYMNEDLATIKKSEDQDTACYIEELNINTVKSVFKSIAKSNSVRIYKTTLCDDIFIEIRGLTTEHSRLTTNKFRKFDESIINTYFENSDGSEQQPEAPSISGVET